LYLYPMCNPIRGVRELEEAWDLLSDDMKAIFRIAESITDALNTVDLGTKRPFGVGKCALWARLTGPQFAAQIAAVVSLVEAPANHRMATTVAKKAMAINFCNKTSHSAIWVCISSSSSSSSTTKFLESPFAGKHPKLIQNGAKAAAAEAAVTAAEATAAADLEKANRLAAEFEAFGSGALTMTLAQEAEPGGPLRACWLTHERLCVSVARSINRAEIFKARTDAAAEAAQSAAAEAAAAEAAAAVEAAAAAKAAAAAGAAAKAAADALGTQAASMPELPKEPEDGAYGVAEGAEETPGRPVFSVGAREEFKARGGSLSSEGADAPFQAERSTPIKVLRSLD
jgi:hypothetical protein